jgi:hypothetical protein
MTKAIRIENADTSNHKIRVRVMQRYALEEDKEVEVIDLSHPTQLITRTVWKGQYLIVEEVE